MRLKQNWRAIQSGREIGFPVCSCEGDLERGRMSVGHRYGVNVTTTCEQGSPICIFHTHPGGIAEPSPADIRAGWDFHLPVCIGIPETGEVRCWHSTRPDKAVALG